MRILARFAVLAASHGSTAFIAGSIDDSFDMGNNSGRFLRSDSNRVVTIGNASFGGSSGVVPGTLTSLHLPRSGHHPIVYLARGEMTSVHLTFESPSTYRTTMAV